MEGGGMEEGGMEGEGWRGEGEEMDGMERGGRRDGRDGEGRERRWEGWNRGEDIYEVWVLTMCEGTKLWVLLGWTVLIKLGSKLL